MGLAEFTAQARPPAVAAKTPDVPKGWERGFESNGTGGKLTTGPLATEASPQLWADLLADWGIDPETVEIVGDPHVKGWDSPVKGTTTGETIRLRSYSVKFRNRTATEDRADVDALCRMASKRKPPRRTPVAVEDAERGFVVALADWQLGKGEGDGTEGTVNRIGCASARVVDRLAELQRNGRPVDVVYLVGLGDLIEGCSEHYAMQTFSTDLHRRDQLKVGRRLILQMVDALVDAGYRVVLTGVAGNHGENRSNGKAFTDWEDNDDLAVIEQVGDILTGNPERYANVSTFLPSMLSMTLDVCGTPVGFAHGHQMGGKTPGMTRGEKWWKDQIVGGQPTAPAQILVTGHFHHFTISEAIGRTHMQCPAMDPGSRWWTETSGQASPAGMLTFGAGAVYGKRSYGDLEII